MSKTTPGLGAHDEREYYGRVPDEQDGKGGDDLDDGERDGDGGDGEHGGLVPGAAIGRRTHAWAVARLVAVLAVLVVVLLVAGLADLLLFLVALVLMVVVHELGHYLTAKWSRMKVTEFFIGFGPRLWSIRRGETVYGVKPLLAGAYVKIPGMTNLDEVDPADESRTYRQKPFYRRIIVASAGSIMHYVMAFFLALVAVVAFGVPSATQVQAGSFVKWAGHRETAAQLAGMKAGDRIVSVDGRRISTPVQISRALDARHGGPVSMVVEDHGRRSTLTVRPVAGHTHGENEVLGRGHGKTEWLIGVQLQTAPLYVSKSPLQDVAWAFADVGHVTSATVVGLGHVFSPGGVSNLFHQVTNSNAAARAAATPASSQRVMSVVGAARLATQAEQAGVYYFISILIALNIVLGLMNMLPMLPLDGGHVAIALYERIRTRRGRPYYQADAAKLLPVVYVFILALLVILGSAIFLDVAHPVANPFG
ncbi:MAG: M50 family metallopeptidase [Acidimicrobiales bacterium]